MRPYRLAIAAAAAIALIPALAPAKKTTYIATDHRFDFVKLSEVKESVAQERGMTHPVTIDEQGLRTALASVNLSRSYVVKKETDTQQVFDEDALNYLAPNFVRAFMQAKPNEEVVFSYLSKQPFFILRNDRLNLGRAWVTGNELHMKFEKLYAKVTGDVDKRGNEARAIANAKGLRVQLDLGPGQQMGIDNSDEIVLDMNYNYAGNLKKPEVAPIEKTMAGEVVSEPAAAEPTPEKAAGKKAKGKEVAAAKDAPATAEPAAATAKPTVKERLEQLDQLKKDGLINKKEYEEKKKEILQEL
jgi:hypothetical protein